MQRAARWDYDRHQETDPEQKKTKPDSRRSDATAPSQFPARYRRVRSIRSPVVHFPRCLSGQTRQNAQIEHGRHDA